MAEVAGASRSLLQQKWGPAPVWLWALGGLVVAYVYAQWRDSKNAAAAAQGAQETYPIASVTGLGAADGESQIAAPQFIIQNQIPTIPVATPIIVNPPPPTGPPTTTPPTTNPPVVTPPPATGGGGGTTPPKQPIQYRVKPGDTLSGIASKYGTTWQALWAYNTTPGVRPAATIATLKKRGPDLLYSNELILVPPK